MTEILDRYRLERRLGLGGMSTVHLALDMRLEREVAVKLLAEHLADDPAFVSRFQREALAAARLIHPNIVQVFDSGRDPTTGQHFIVMEYVAGPSMAELLRDRGHLPVEEALTVITQACRGLEYAHRNGVVHRDVKPGNLLRSPDATIKLADFGIAKATEQSAITQVGSVLGTAAYLAPEQAHGEEASPRSDLYSLGVVSYQLLSGRLPYEATSLSELVYKQQHDAPPRLSQLNAEVSAPLATAIAIALSIDPRDRYGSAQEMGDALHSAARGVEPATQALSPGTGGYETAQTSILSRSTEATRAVRPADVAVPREPVPARRRREPVAPPARRAPARKRNVRAWVIIALIAALIIAGIALIATQASSTSKFRDQQVTLPTLGQTADSLKQLISNNTR
jgi:serine/threonine protein kinase